MSSTYMLGITMTLPWTVDSKTWVIMLPVSIVLIWIYFKPSDHVIKRIWWAIVLAKARAFNSKVSEIPLQVKRQTCVLFWVFICAFILFSLCSFAVAMGWIHNPAPKSFIESEKTFKPEDYEAVFTEHSMAVRKKQNSPSSQQSDRTNFDSRSDSK